MCVSDYMADTMHLSTLEHGAYILLLFAYYQSDEALPDDDVRLSAITRLSVSDWSAIRSAMSKFFKVGSGVWKHGRAEREILARKNAQKARQMGAKRTNEARRTKSVTVSVTDTPSDTGASRSTVGSHNHNHIKKSTRAFIKPVQDEVIAFCLSLSLPKSDADWFFFKCEGNGWTNGGKPIKDWKATIRSWMSAEYLPSLKNKSAGTQAGRPVNQPIGQPPPGYNGKWGNTYCVNGTPMEN